MRVGGDARPDSPLSVRVRLACPVSRPLNVFVLPSPLTSTCKLETRVAHVARVIHRLPFYPGVRSLFSVQPRHIREHTRTVSSADRYTPEWIQYLTE